MVEPTLLQIFDNLAEVAIGRYFILRQGRPVRSYTFRDQDCTEAIVTLLREEMIMLGPAPSLPLIRCADLEANLDYANPESQP